MMTMMMMTTMNGCFKQMYASTLDCKFNYNDDNDNVDDNDDNDDEWMF